MFSLVIRTSQLNRRPGYNNSANLVSQRSTTTQDLEFNDLTSQAFDLKRIRIVNSKKNSARHLHLLQEVG